LILSDINKYQPKAWSILARSFLSKKIAGTYLFHGRPGLGDWHLAISLAALLNCENPVKSKSDARMVLPCDKCRSCRNIASLNFEGFFFAVPIKTHKKLEQAVELTNEILEIKKAEPFKILSASSYTSIPIAMAREIQKRLAHKPGEGITRVVMFYQMEKMLLASADALLKLIEEPPPETVIVLTTYNPEALLPTILSRSQKIKLDRVPVNVMTDYMKENYDLSENRALLFAGISEGSLGRAVEMIDGEGEKASSRRAVGFLLFKSLFNDQTPVTLSHVVELLNPRDLGEAEELLLFWQSLLRDCSNYNVTSEEDNIVNIDFVPEIKKLSAFFNSPQLIASVVENIKNSLADLRRSVHIQGALMALIIKIKSSIKAA